MNRILNYLLISPKIATSGQPGRNQFKRIAAENYSTVINLAMPDSENAITDEGCLITQYNMTYIHIPVSFDTPAHKQLECFFKIMEIFKDEKIWIHCAKNYRVSSFLYLYNRIVLGFPEDKARASMFPGWTPNVIWEKFMTDALGRIS